MLSIYDIQENFTAVQQIRVDLKIDAVSLNDVNGYASLLTCRLVSISSDVQRHFDLV